MTSAKDFAELFSGKPVAPKVPTMPLDGFRFRLLDFDAYHEWYTTGEVKEDGSPKWALSDDVKISDDGDRVRCVLELQLQDANGLATATGAPFVDSTHYFDKKTVAALVKKQGDFIKLVNPRIEFIEKSETNKKGFARIVTRMFFAFDDVEI